jgi:hypothetical protein
MSPISIIILACDYIRIMKLFFNTRASLAVESDDRCANIGIIQQAR